MDTTNPVHLQVTAEFMFGLHQSAVMLCCVRRKKLFLVKQVEDNVTGALHTLLCLLPFFCKFNGARDSNIQYKHSLTYNTKFALKDKIAEAILNTFRSKCCSDRQV